MPKARRHRSKSKVLPSVRNVGFLLATSPAEWRDFTTWFEGKLKALNAANKVIYLPPNGAAGDPTAIAKAATDLVNYYEVIVTASTAAALALKKATQGTNVQFVYASVGDPVASGLSPTPNGNFTGGSNGQADPTVVVPRRVKRMINNTAKFKPNFAVVGDYSDPAHRVAMNAVYDELINQGKPVPLLPSDQACLLNSSVSVTKFDAFMSNLATNSGVHSIYICSDLWITVNAKALNKSAHKAKIKTMFEFKEITQNGGGDDGDDSTQNSWQPLFETAAVYADKILNGAKAGNLAMYSLKKTGGSVIFHRRK
jgi:ABC-type uncharacterized transport system substrate-binding protein